MEDKLIEAVQMFPCLYDKSKLQYRNKLLKEKAWSSVSSATGATVEQCQNRWRSLRDRYVKQVALTKPKSGAAAAEINHWRYMDAMSFLKRHVTPRKTLSNMQWESPDLEVETPTPDYHSFSPFMADNSVEFMNESFLESTVEIAESSVPVGEEVTAKKTPKRQKEAHQRFDLLCGAVTDLIESKKEKKSRNAEFLKVLDGYLLKYDEEEQDRLKMQILNMVYPPK